MTDLDALCAATDPNLLIGVLKGEIEIAWIALLQERERCAKVCRDAKRLPPRDQFEDGANRTAAYLEHSIRALPDLYDLTAAREMVRDAERYQLARDKNQWSRNMEEAKTPEAFDAACDSHE